jgi:hypothetical protein
MLGGLVLLCQGKTEYWELKEYKKTTQLGLEQKSVGAYCRGVMT